MIRIILAIFPTFLTSSFVSLRFLPKSPLRARSFLVPHVFFPNRLLAGFPRLCAALYADTLLTRFLSAFGFLFSLLLF